MKQHPQQHSQPRRRNLLLPWLALVVLGVVSSPLWARGSGRSQPEVSGVRVVVQPGDTLWSIAEQHGPQGQDLRKLTFRLRKANHLDGGVLHPGEVLVVPQE